MIILYCDLMLDDEPSPWVEKVVIRYQSGDILSKLFKGGVSSPHAKPQNLTFYKIHLY